MPAKAATTAQICWACSGPIVARRRKNEVTYHKIARMRWAIRDCDVYISYHETRRKVTSSRSFASSGCFGNAKPDALSVQFSQTEVESLVIFKDDALNDSQRGSPTATWEQSLSYTVTFEDTKAMVLRAICEWYPHRTTRELDLSRFEACVAVKNYDWNIVLENSSFRRLFTGGIPGVGRGADAFVYRKSNSLSANTDQLIRDGATMIEFEHLNGDHLGRLCTVRTYKYRLDELEDPNFHILCISRPVAVIGKTEKEQEKSLNELFCIFQRLDDTDQTICRLDAKGDTTKNIASSVGLTSRSIEIRRKKMMDVFDVQRPMELIRITIRLEEHGLLS